MSIEPQKSCQFLYAYNFFIIFINKPLFDHSCFNYKVQLTFTEFIFLPLYLTNWARLLLLFILRGQLCSAEILKKNNTEKFQIHVTSPFFVISPCFLTASVSSQPDVVTELLLIVLRPSPTTQPPVVYVQLYFIYLFIFNSNKLTFISL